MATSFAALVDDSKSPARPSPIAGARLRRRTTSRAISGYGQDRPRRGRNRAGHGDRAPPGRGLRQREHAPRLRRCAPPARPCSRPATGRGVESDQVALERGRLDAVIAGLLFMAGMRRSEVSALRWADVAESTHGAGILVTVRRSKTNQEGEVNDVLVREGRRGARPPHVAGHHESGAG